MMDYISREAVKSAIADTCAECRDACLEFDGILADCNQCLINGLKANIHAIPAADVQETPRWISVKERLPQEHKMVLAYCADDDFYYISRMHKSFEDYEVTHWMPLPTPPKEDEA